MGKPRVIDRRRKYDQVSRAIREDLAGYVVKVGLQGSEGASDRDGITNAELAAVHEFGAHINHPGGTPYFFAMGEWSEAGRSGGMSQSSEIVFFSKSSSSRSGAYSGNWLAATRLTKPHAIDIPERSFMRATFDENVAEYRKRIREVGQLVIEGKITTRQGLEAFGVKAEGDIRETIQNGIAPPLKPSTLQRKTKAGKVGTTPLIDDAIMIGGITSVVERGDMSKTQIRRGTK